MKVCFIDNIINFFSTLEGITTALIVLVLLLKLYINRKTTSLHHKKLFISIPSEITFLVVGFLLSKAITIQTTSTTLRKTDTTPNKTIGGIVVSLIILVVQYAFERWLDDKISGKVNIGLKALIGLMYIISIVLYIVVVFGG